MGGNSFLELPDCPDSLWAHPKCINKTQLSTSKRFPSSSSWARHLDLHFCPALVLPRKVKKKKKRARLVSAEKGIPVSISRRSKSNLLPCSSSQVEQGALVRRAAVQLHPYGVACRTSSHSASWQAWPLRLLSDDQKTPARHQWGFTELSRLLCSLHAPYLQLLPGSMGGGEDSSVSTEFII